MSPRPVRPPAPIDLPPVPLPPEPVDTAALELELEGEGWAFPSPDLVTPTRAAVDGDGRLVLCGDDLGLLANVAELQGVGFLHGYGLSIDAPCVHAACCGENPDYKLSPRERGRV